MQLLMGAEGDSFARWDSVKGAGLRRTSACSPIPAFLAMTGGKYTFALDWNKGVGGQTGQQIWDRMDVWAGNPAGIKIVDLSVGSNDIIPALSAGLSVGQTKTNILTYINLIRGYLLQQGVEMVLLRGLSYRAAWGSVPTAQAHAVVDAVNAVLATYQGYVNQNAVVSADVSRYTIDGCHLNQEGGFALARRMFNLLPAQEPYTVHPDAILAETKNAKFTTNSALVYNGQLQKTHAYFEVQCDFHAAATVRPDYFMIELYQGDTLLAQSNCNMPPPDKIQKLTKFPHDDARSWQVQMINEGKTAAYTFRTPVASGLAGTQGLVGKIRINHGAPYRVFKWQLVNVNL